jgi:putative transposase
MARLARWTLVGHAHWVSQRGHGGQHVFVDDLDRQAYLGALQEAAHTEQVRLHAHALTDQEVHLLASPGQPQSISRLMQAIGRRYVSAYHRRHGGSGTLWEGRFRCAVVEPGPSLLEVLCLIDGLCGPQGSSYRHRALDERQSTLVDPPEFWALGNTPFERQAAWVERMAHGLPVPRVAALMAAARGGWVIGSPAFQAQVSEASARPAAPRPRGRPKAVPRA